MFDLVQYDELEKGVTLPWFLKTEDGALAGTASNAAISLPSGWIRFVDDDDDDCLYITTSSGPRRYLVRRPVDWIISWQQDSDDGTMPDGDPQYYGIRETTIYVSPVPTTSYTVYANYWAHDTAFSSLGAGAQNQWLTYAPGVLTWLTGMRMAEDLEHDTAFAKFQRRYAAANARLTSELALREVDGREISMGSQA